MLAAQNVYRGACKVLSGGITKSALYVRWLDMGSHADARRALSGRDDSVLGVVSFLLEHLDMASHRDAWRALRG